MSETVTLAQLSDVHLSPVRGFGLRHLNLKRGLGYVNWQRSRRRVHMQPSLDLIVADMKMQAPDHIAVTGDLINLGLPAEYEAARVWLRELGEPDAVTVVPGNHDIYTTIRDDPGVARWADYMRPDAWGTRFAFDPAHKFPFVRRIGPAALVCLNSAVQTPPFVAAGELGRQQLAALPEILRCLEREGLVRIILIHHPPLPGQAPPRRALRDADALAAVLAEHGAEVVLHGHNHRDMHFDFSWARGRMSVLGVASGSAGRLHRDEPLGRYHLLRVTRVEDVPAIELTTRGLDASGNLVQLDHKRLL
jgi:3',5'-cyclic AMP phosphodiesterase CpdA